VRGQTISMVIAISSVFCMLLGIFWLLPLGQLILLRVRASTLNTSSTLLVLAALQGALGALAVATAIGLIRRNGWARLSTQWLAGILLVAGTISGVSTLKMLAPGPLSRSIVESLLGLSGLVFFRRRSIKQVFH
jgi:hypothetical protein